MDYAKRHCADALTHLSIRPDMDADAVQRELGLFWNKLFSEVSDAIPPEAPEKDIYRILIAEQKALPSVHQWEKKLPPPPPKKKRMPIFRILLMCIAIAAVFATLIITHIQKNFLSVQVSLIALLPLILSLLLLFRKEQVAPRAPSLKERHLWDIDAIREYLTSRAAAVDTNATQLLPRSNGKPEALPLVMELLRQTYQSSAPANRRITDQIDHYLMQHRIEKIDYSPEFASLFTLLPANGEKTMAPALVRDGEVLSMGTACVPMSEMR